MSTLKLIVAWYLIGWVCLIINLMYKNYVKKEDIVIRVSDVQFMAGLALAGALLILVPFFVTAAMIINRIDVDYTTIVWSNRRSKNRRILFDKDDN